MDPRPERLKPPRPPRNPGPSWGYAFLRLCDRILPEFIFKPLRAIGTAIAVAAMPSQRRHSASYLARVLPRAPGIRDVFLHFFAFEESLMGKLRVANGRRIPCEYDPSGLAFGAWLENGGPALLGTMHVGVSDMLGFQLGVNHGRRVHIVRQRVANSHDTEGLELAGQGSVRFIWAGDPADLILAIKGAADSGDPIAMQCDRVENTARTEGFEFLGARRRFPMTIYRLALVFDRPVLLTVGVPISGGRSRLYGVPRFEIAAGESRDRTLERARQHFQSFLNLVERLLREQPYQWFNFLPLNPEAGPPPGSRARA
jgi:predicted LPLAT superfamily acyltransferase